MLEERADLYYMLYFSFVHKHKVLLVMSLGIEKSGKRAVGKQSSSSNGDSEKKLMERKRKRRN
jgi:hypothetical protein